MEVEQTKAALEKLKVARKDVAQALRLFGPVWDELFPAEQRRVLHLLLESVVYHGGDGTLTLAFRDAGIKALCEEMAQADGQEAEESTSE